MNYKTLYSTKNVGDIITIPHSTMGNIDFIVIGKNQDGSGKLTLLSKNIIKLIPFDAIESSNTDTNRTKYGNNRYSMSNILQWMNSNASSNWYTKQHSYDTIPNSNNVWSSYNPYDNIPGFLYGFNNDFKEVLTTVSKRTVLSRYDGGGYEDVSSKMFLLSTTEVGLVNENNIAEGSIYTYFSNNNNTNSNRISYPTEYAVTNSEYTHSTLTTSKGWYWWLRTPGSGTSSNVRGVGPDGPLSHDGACGGDCGLRVACVI